MYYLYDFCCICLSNNEVLQQLSTTDNDNITYLSKITYVVPEMSYIVRKTQRLLCKECCDNINITYKFRQQCLRNNSMLTDYISQLRSVSNVSGKISIRLTDFQLQQDEVCDKSKDKNEETHTLSTVNVIKTEPNEENFTYTDRSLMNQKNTFRFNYKNTVDESLSDNIPTDFQITVDNVYNKSVRNTSEDKNVEVIDPLSLGKEIKTEPNDTNCLRIDHENISGFNYKNSEKISISSNISSTNSQFTVSDNLNPLNKIKEEPNSINVEEIIIKTEENEDYIDENDVISLENEVKNEITTTKCINECTICKNTFNNTYSLNNHMRIHLENEVENEITTTKCINECTVCKKTFNNTYSLNNHLRIHTREERSYKCTVCFKTFILSVTLNKHMRKHTEKESHECTVCKKIFAKSGYLKEHMRIHTGIRNNVCDICNKTFMFSYDLKVHKRIHTGERPYKCIVCLKTFTLSGTLNKHMRTHTGELPYECTICQKKFTKSGNLKEHLRVHTGERPFKCIVCNKTFAYANVLKAHMKIHAGDRSV